MIFLVPLHNPKLIALILALQIVCVGWVPYFIAMNRRALHRHAIGVAGLVFAAVPPMLLPIIFWALMGRREEAEGPGFPIEPNDDRATAARPSRDDPSSPS